MTYKQLKRPPTVGIEYSGQWIAWGRNQTRIIASGRTFAEAHAAALKAGESAPLMEKVPRLDRRFVGRET